MEVMAPRPVSIWIFASLSVLLFVFLISLVVLPALHEIQDTVTLAQYDLAARAKERGDLFFSENPRETFLPDGVLSGLSLGKSDVVYVVDNEGRMRGANLPLPLDQISFKDTSLFREISKAGEIRGEEIPSDTFFEGKQVLLTSLPLNVPNLRVVVESPSSEILRSRDRVVAFAFILTIALAIILFLLFLNSAKLLRLTRDLSLEKNHFFSIVNVLADGIIEYDQNYKIRLMNPRAEEILGIKSSRVYGADIKKSQDAKLASLYKILSHNDKAEKRIVFENLGEKVYLELSTLEIGKEPNRSFVKVIRDTSRFFHLTEMKSEFISIAAHQLRTPLAAVKWALRVLLEGEAGPLEPGQKDYLQKMYASNERMIGLVSDLLDVTRIEEGRFGYEFKEQDFIEVLGAALKNAEIPAKQKSIRLNFDAAVGVKTVFTFDPQRIQIVLSNLLDNALNYTSAGGLITVSIKERNAFLEVSISDTGIGIPEHQKSRVFTKFFRADNAVRLQTEGSGLGLFITKNIIKRHGGDIRFVSEIGKGTTFIFTLPLKKEYIPPSEKPLEHFLEVI